MKQKIIQALKTDDESVIKLNEVSHLVVYPDSIHLVFDDKIYDIESRDYDGIIEEIKKRTLDYFSDYAFKLILNLGKKGR